MKSMPYEIKQKLRQLANNRLKSSQLSNELTDAFEKYGFDKDAIDRITGNSYVHPCNEALAYIENAEGDTEDSIEMIEEVFLDVVNKKEGESK